MFEKCSFSYDDWVPPKTDICELCGMDISYSTMNTIFEQTKKGLKNFQKGRYCTQCADKLIEKLNKK